MTVSGSPAPLARRQNLIINETAQHFIVYDERSHHIHQLNSASAAVWRHCDGQQSVVDLQRIVSLDMSERVPIESITLALAQLSDANLLETAWVLASPSQRQSRRSLLRKTFITGAIAAPTLISISAPHAAAAQSCPSGQAECLGTCCSTGQICTQFGCCLPDQICGQACCISGRACASGGCCAPERVVCNDHCCAEGEECYRGICCAPGKGCGLICCGPNQTCVDGSFFGVCE